jgi:hypothetical protein
MASIVSREATLREASRRHELVYPPRKHFELAAVEFAEPNLISKAETDGLDQAARCGNER